LGGKKIVTSNRRELTCTPPGGRYGKGKRMGITGTQTIPVTIPGSIPENYGKLSDQFFDLFPGLTFLNVSSRTAISPDFALFFKPSK